jgi:ribosomal protein S12 methylthiotransferase
MPIQHVSDKMLNAMRRTTSKKDIIDTIAKLRREIPSITIRTSLIVGFPGETEADFEELCQFVKEYPLDNIGIFRYSREEKSHSYNLPDQVPQEVKEARYHKLMQIQQKTLKTLNKKWLKQTIPVVIEGYHPETKLLMIGRHAGQCPEIDGQVIINDTRGVTAFGKIYPVKISEVTEYDLIGGCKQG